MLESKIVSLQQEKNSLSRENKKLEIDTIKLKNSNYFKLIMLFATLMIGATSLLISIWSFFDRDRKGLSESSIAVSGLSLTLSLVGLFSDCRSNCCKFNSEEDNESDDEYRMDV